MWRLNLPGAAAKAKVVILLVATVVQSESIMVERSENTRVSCRHAPAAEFGQGSQLPQSGKHKCCRECGATCTQIFVLMILTGRKLSMISQHRMASVVNINHAC